MIGLGTSTGLYKAGFFSPPWLPGSSPHSPSFSSFVPFFVPIIFLLRCGALPCVHTKPDTSIVILSCCYSCLTKSSIVLASCISRNNGCCLTNRLSGLPSFDPSNLFLQTCCPWRSLCSTIARAPYLFSSRVCLRSSSASASAGQVVQWPPLGWCRRCRWSRRLLLPERW